jgi:hypothetical protein
MKPLKKPHKSPFGQGCFLGFALFWTGFSVFMFIMAWNDSEIIGMAFISIFVLIGLIMLTAALWRYFSRLRLAAPVLMISNTELQVGERFNLEYQQTFKVAGEIAGASVSLMKQEAATYTQGTSTYTDRHKDTVETYDIPGHRVEAGEVLRESFSMAIPVDAMHTFIANNNKIQWFIHVHVDLLNWPDLDEDYEIRVLAQKAWGI